MQISITLPDGRRFTLSASFTVERPMDTAGQSNVSQSDDISAALVDVLHGSIGGKAGYGFETPSFSGTLPRY